MMRRELEESMHAIIRCICYEKERFINKVCSSMESEGNSCCCNSNEVDLRECCSNEKDMHKKHKMDMMHNKISAQLNDLKESIDTLNRSVSKHVEESREKTE